MAQQIKAIDMPTPDVVVSTTHPPTVDDISGLRIVSSAPAFEVAFWSPEPLTRLQFFLKRTMDVVLAGAASFVALPICLLTALAVRLDSAGPVFYRQDRVGFQGQLFTLFKFRSMVDDAERETGPVWASRNDPRITRVGRIIRKLGIDELPQLYNVLRGEMSLVGPRPERPHFVDRFRREIPGYAERLRVLPGITGLAQVKHKYDETIDDVRQKLRFDFTYIRTHSFFKDCFILFYTIYIILTGKGQF